MSLSAVCDTFRDLRSAGVLSSCLATLAVTYAIWKSNQVPLPPGPRASFFTGNIHQIPRLESWKVYAEWAKQYGSVFLIRIFNQKIIVLNSHSDVMDLLEARSSNYSERPIVWMYKELVERKWAVFNISTAHPRFRLYRKLLHTALDPKAVKNVRSLQEKHTGALLRSLQQTPEAFINHVRRNAGAVILELSYGWVVDSDDDYFVRVVEETFPVQAELVRPGRWLVDTFPILRFIPSWMPGGGFKRKAEEYKKYFHRIDRIPHTWAMEQIRSGSFIESFTSRNMQPENGKPPDEEMEDCIRWCSAALYAGGADTTVAAMTTFFLTMTLYPAAQQRAQEEIDRVVGTGRLPNVDDRGNLPYVEALIKEVLRWAPAVPLGLPHAVVQDDIYQGYFLPRGSTIVANIWALMHDPAVYPDPQVFNPDRFLGEDLSSSQLDPTRYAFGFSRRICPGAHFAGTQLFANIVNILATFTILKPLDENGNQFDPKYEYTTSVTTHPKPFPCRIVPRPHAAERMNMME